MVLILTWAKGAVFADWSNTPAFVSHSAAEEMSVAAGVCVALLADRPVGTKYKFYAQKQEQKQEQEHGVDKKRS